MREKLLWFCSCTALEIMTAVGLTGYLLLTKEITLAIIVVIVFSKILVLHFVVDYYDKKKQKIPLKKV